MEVSSRYIQFWTDTARALTALVCGHAGGADMDALVLKCNPFAFHEDSKETPFTLQREWIRDVFQNEVLFDALLAVLNREAGKAWPERYLDGICLLNEEGLPLSSCYLDETGCPLSPRMEAEYIYFTACEELMTKYSGMLGISLNYIALLATMAYEKKDFKPGTQICFGAWHLAAFSIELRTGYGEGTVFDDKSLRTVRKLLSGVKKDENALYFGRESGGTSGYRCEGYVKKDVPVAFRVIFYGDEKWGFRVGNAKNDLLTAKNRQFQCFDATFRYSLRCLEEEFRDCDASFTSGGLREFLKAARSQEHGTSVVFAPFESFPAVRERFEVLEAVGRARSVEDGNVEKNDGFYRAVTDLARIDGALVADLGKNDYRFAYFSVILDGRAVKGWASSGARANSVLTFVGDLLRSELEKAAEEELAVGMVSREELIQRLRDRRMPIAAVIFSEDGYVTPVLGSELAGALCAEAADRAMSKSGILPHAAVGRGLVESRPHIV